MAAPKTSREVLIAEAIGDLGHVLVRAEALQSSIDESCQALVHAHAQLADQLAAFEVHVAGLTEKAKIQAVKHILARTDEAARRSIEQQTRAMANSARVAFSAELGATLQRLQQSLQLPTKRPERRWGPWLMALAAAIVASAATWIVAQRLCGS